MSRHDLPTAPSPTTTSLTLLIIADELITDPSGLGLGSCLGLGSGLGLWGHALEDGHHALVPA
eukprot:453992-Prymnesium_polylepis.1